MAALATARERMRSLNDQLRQYGIGGTVVITPGLQALGLDFLLLVKDAVASFEDFDADDDPYGEHDFGTVRVQGHTVFFKIDYELERALAQPRRSGRDHARPHHYAGRGVLTVAWGERDIASAPPTTTTSALPSMMLWAAETTA